jgi:hypothetical protein
MTASRAAGGAAAPNGVMSSPTNTRAVASQPVQVPGLFLAFLMAQALLEVTVDYPDHSRLAKQGWALRAIRMSSARIRIVHNVLELTVFIVRFSLHAWTL